jgi:RNA polymerase sigma-70 factor (ECF subfamily)
MTKPDKEQLFEAMLEKNRRRLAAIAKSYEPGDDWRDLYQEMLLQIWKSLDSFEGRSALDTWVYRVALNTAIAHRRKAKEQSCYIVSRSEPPEPPVVYTTSPAGPTRELHLLAEFVLTLNKVDRAVFLLYLEDFSYRQMSEIMGLTEGNIGVRLSRIKKAFTEMHIGA